MEKIAIKDNPFRSRVIGYENLFGRAVTLKSTWAWFGSLVFG